MMDSECETQTVIIDERAARRNRIVNRILFGYNAFSFVATIIVYIFTIIIAVPVLQTCFVVALVVMIIGAVLGFIQLVPEFFRNFIKLEPKRLSYVNYFYVFIIVVRTIWLIASTIIVAESQCNDITYAWISIYVNWGIFVWTAIIVCIVVIVRTINEKRETRL